MKGGGGFAHITIGTAEEIVGTHTFVGGAVTVEPLGGDFQCGVCSKGNIVAVEAVCLVEDCQHTTTLTAAAGCEQQEQ